jgi:hypothetical protein
MKIYCPLDEYRDTYKTLHNKNVAEFFEELLRLSGVNENENSLTVKDINKHNAEIEKYSSSFRTAKFWRGLLIFLTVICGVVFGVFLYDIFEDIFENTQETTVIVLSATVVLALCFILLIVKKLNPKIKSLNTILNKLKDELQQLLQQAWKQVNPLIDNFTRYISSRLMEKTYSLIQLDDVFDIRRYDYLSRKFKLWDNSDVNESTLSVQSGEINGNPFCFFKTLNHWIGSKTYHGSKEIYWTEYYTDTNGKRRSRQRSQTLYADVQKPYPEYATECYLIYGNEAAPNLHFSREPSNVNLLTDKQLVKKVKKGSNRLKSLMRKAISMGKNFTSMGNEEFDVLFGALDRDYEVEFRLLFTPIAQREMLRLMKDKTEGWGDDFGFRKSRMINRISPRHLYDIDISGSPKHYEHYSVAEIRKQFNDYNNMYFRAVYFTFAPLLAIPLYQDHKPHEFIYKDVYDSNVCCFAHECAVNRMDLSKFRHPASVREDILKTKIIDADKENDRVLVTAYGYKSINRIDYVLKWGGDGKMHQVPVNWVEYQSVSQSTNVSLNSKNL